MQSDLTTTAGHPVLAGGARRCILGGGTAGDALRDKALAAPAAATPITAMPSIEWTVGDVCHRTAFVESFRRTNAPSRPFPDRSP